MSKTNGNTVSLFGNEQKTSVLFQGGLFGNNNQNTCLFGYNNESTSKGSLSGNTTGVLFGNNNANNYGTSTLS